MVRRVDSKTCVRPATRGKRQVGHDADDQGPPLPQPDPLTQVLQGVRLRCMIPRSHEMTAPWAVRFGGTPASEVRRHLVSMGFTPPKHDAVPARGSLVAITRGECWLTTDGERGPIRLASGDLVLLTRPAPFTLGDDPQTAPTNARRLIRREHVELMLGLRHGGGGPQTRFLCGPFAFADDPDHPMLAALPPMIHVRASADDGTQAWLRSTLAFIDGEVSRGRPGVRGLVDQLAQVLFTQAVRAYAAEVSDGGSPDWFRAMLDPHVAPAVGLMHEYPGEPWSVTALAERVGCSRSGFAAKFTAAVGRPPLQYLIECRMRTARALLRDTRLGVRTIARQVGYATESAFINAFRRLVGLSPLEYRDSIARRDGASP